MNYLTTILTAVLTWIARFFAAITSPDWYTQTFATIRHPLRSRVSETSSSNHGQTAVDAKARRQKFMAVIAVLAIAGSLVSLFRTVLPSTPKVNHQPFVGLGEVLGEETAKGLRDYGRVAIVISDSHNQSGNPLNDTLKAFRGIMEKHPDIEITTEVVHADANNPTIVDGLSPARYVELLKKYSQYNGVVFFTGLPQLELSSPLQLPVPRPHIIAVQTGRQLTKSYFENKFVDVAICPLGQSRAEAAVNPKTPHEWFDRYFQVVTTQNYTALPY